MASPKHAQETGSSSAFTVLRNRVVGVATAQKLGLPFITLTKRPFNFVLSGEVLQIPEEHMAPNSPEYYSNIKRIAMSYVSTKEVNIATLAKFEKTWGANIARNIQAFSRYPGACIFFDRFRDMPAIVAAAGPSLTESIGFIKETAGRAVVIAVDTSYKILKKNNITNKQIQKSKYNKTNEEYEQSKLDMKNKITKARRNIISIELVMFSK